MKRAIIEVRLPSPRAKVSCNPGEILIAGRSNVVDISVPLDPKLSAKHFSIAWDGRQCRLRDLGSHGGTWLHGTRVDEVALNHAAWIRAGTTDFMVYLEAHTSPPRRRSSPLWPTHAAAARGALRRTEGPLFAVVDASRGTRPLQLMREAVDQHASLYDGTRGHALANVAPYLVEIRPDSGLLDRLLDEGWGARWAIFLSCKRPFTEIRRHLRRSLLVDVENSTRQFYFRFYDPFVLSDFLPSCTPRQRADFFGEFTAFYAEGTSGELLTFTP